MSSTLTLDKVANELIKSADDSIWLTDKPKIRESWVKAVETHPDLLERYSEQFRYTLEQYLRDLNSLGRGMMRVNDDNLIEALANVRSNTDSLCASRNNLRKELNGISAILNLTPLDAINSETLKSVARNYAIYLEVGHDTNNYIAGTVILNSQDIGEQRRKQLPYVGKHIFLTACGLLNIINYGVVMQKSLDFDFALRLQSFFKLVHPDGIEVSYENLNTIRIQSDMFNLYRSFFNLVDNAMKRGKASKLKIEGTQNESNVTIRFMDNGIGLPNENEIFEYGASYSGGTGLGLFLVKQVIESHNGTITAKSHNDDQIYHGACFTIKLPIKQKEGYIYYPTKF